MDKAGTAVALGIGALVVGGLVWSDGNRKHTEAANDQVVIMATVATVTIEQAIQTASENFSGKVIRAELEKNHDRTVWEVDMVTADRRIMSVQIDALSGSVVGTEEKTVGQKHGKANGARQADGG